ncbi:helix-turn-helix domain-containing protein [Leptospira wolffii]|uniref:helix-turn-helix domain-containing protein n=1 Tax=Leptospira wolffii TaxID=409998 RepID=UPI0003109F1E|nr:helix-turn-helix domain-containing protein [Leptospira wolffii]EPG68265.1 DNA-binding helix-turn-helix protein [Leptospira wolffii serovar Khorat str. Khorat-H2]
MLNPGLVTPILYFGSGLSFLLVIQRLISPKNPRENRISALLFLSLGIIQFSVANVIWELDQTYPHSIFLLLTSFSTIGPLSLLYTHSLVYPNQTLYRDIRVHFLIPGMFFLGECLFFARPWASIIEDLAELRAYRYKHYLSFGFFATTALTTAYFVFRYRMLLTVISVPELKAQIRFILILATVTMVAMCSLVFGFMFGSSSFFSVGGILVTLIIFMLFLAPSRYPDFFAPLTREVRKKKYEKSLLVGLDLNLLELRIEELMNEDRLYRDPDLTLHSLSEDLGIKPYQLTEFLNEHLQTGFHNYINRFRIDEAVRLLGENPDQDILSICYFVGFNSKSSFNDAFRKVTGKTPSQLRRKKQENSGNPKIHTSRSGQALGRNLGGMVELGEGKKNGSLETSSRLKVGEE